jgi:hypothetical protein
MAREKSVKRAKKKIKSRKKRPFLAYPSFIVLLICSGVFLIAWTWRAGAADIFVSAKVSAPFVTDPAVITSPSNGDRFTLTPISVRGNCPTSPNYTAAYVEIFDNNVMRGTAICDGNAQFNLSVSLFVGANSLTAHVFNSTDDEGPVSDEVKVIYAPPQPPSTGGGNPGQGHGGGSGGNSSPTPLNLLTSFTYKGYHIGDRVEWPISVSGGTAPYAISVDWGDGTLDLISRPTAGEFNISHVYQQSGGYKDSYTIKVKASDAAGQSSFIQFFVIVTPSSVGQSANIFNKPTPKLPGGFNWLLLAWPAYALVLLMTFSYWLGEREELIILRKKGLIKRRA